MTMHFRPKTYPTITACGIEPRDEKVTIQSTNITNLVTCPDCIETTSFAAWGRIFTPTPEVEVATPIFASMTRRQLLINEAVDCERKLATLQWWKFGERRLLKAKIDHIDESLSTVDRRI